MDVSPSTSINNSIDVVLEAVEGNFLSSDDIDNIPPENDPAASVPTQELLDDSEMVEVNEPPCENDIDNITITDTYVGNLNEQEIQLDMIQSDHDKGEADSPKPGCSRSNQNVCDTDDNVEDLWLESGTSGLKVDEDFEVIVKSLETAIVETDRYDIDTVMSSPSESNIPTSFINDADKVIESLEEAIIESTCDADPGISSDSLLNDLSKELVPSPLITPSLSEIVEEGEKVMLSDDVEISDEITKELEAQSSKIHSEDISANMPDQYLENLIQPTTISDFTAISDEIPECEAYDEQTSSLFEPTETETELPENFENQPSILELQEATMICDISEEINKNLENPVSPEVTTFSNLVDNSDKELENDGVNSQISEEDEDKLLESPVKSINKKSVVKQDEPVPSTSRANLDTEISSNVLPNLENVEEQILEMTENIFEIESMNETNQEIYTETSEVKAENTILENEKGNEENDLNSEHVCTESKEATGENDDDTLLKLESIESETVEFVDSILKEDLITNKHTLPENEKKVEINEEDTSTSEDKIDEIKESQEVSTSEDLDNNSEMKDNNEDIQPGDSQEKSKEKIDCTDSPKPDTSKTDATSAETEEVKGIVIQDSDSVLISPTKEENESEAATSEIIEGKKDENINEESDIVTSNMENKSDEPEEIQSSKDESEEKQFSKDDQEESATQAESSGATDEKVPSPDDQENVETDHKNDIHSHVETSPAKPDQKESRSKYEEEYDMYDKPDAREVFNDVEHLITEESSDKETVHYESEDTGLEESDYADAQEELEEKTEESSNECSKDSSPNEAREEKEETPEEGISEENLGEKSRKEDTEKHADVEEQVSEKSLQKRPDVDENLSKEDSENEDRLVTKDDLENKTDEVHLANQNKLDEKKHEEHLEKNTDLEETANLEEKPSEKQLEKNTDLEEKVSEDNLENNSDLEEKRTKNELENKIDLEEKTIKEISEPNTDLEEKTVEDNSEKNVEIKEKVDAEHLKKSVDLEEKSLEENVETSPDSKEETNEEDFKQISSQENLDKSSDLLEESCKSENIVDLEEEASRGDMEKSADLEENTNQSDLKISTSAEKESGKESLQKSADLQEESEKINDTSIEEESGKERLEESSDLEEKESIREKIIENDEEKNCEITEQVESKMDVVDEDSNIPKIEEHVESSEVDINKENVMEETPESAKTAVECSPIEQLETNEESDVECKEVSESQQIMNEKDVSEVEKNEEGNATEGTSQKEDVVADEKSDPVSENKTSSEVETVSETTTENKEAKEVPSYDADRIETKDEENDNMEVSESFAENTVQSNMEEKCEVSSTEELKDNEESTSENKDVNEKAVQEEDHSKLFAKEESSEATEIKEIEQDAESVTHETEMSSTEDVKISTVDADRDNKEMANDEKIIAILEEQYEDNNDKDCKTDEIVEKQAKNEVDTHEKSSETVEDSDQNKIENDNTIPEMDEDTNEIDKEKKSTAIEEGEAKIEVENDKKITEMDEDRDKTETEDDKKATEVEEDRIKSEVQNDGKSTELDEDQDKTETEDDKKATEVEEDQNKSEVQNDEKSIEKDEDRGKIETEDVKKIVEVDEESNKNQIESDNKTTEMAEDRNENEIDSGEETTELGDNQDKDHVEIDKKTTEVAEDLHKNEAENDKKTAEIFEEQDRNDIPLDTKTTETDEDRDKIENDEKITEKSEVFEEVCVRSDAKEDENIILNDVEEPEQVSSAQDIDNKPIEKTVEEIPESLAEECALNSKLEDMDECKSSAIDIVVENDEIESIVENVSDSREEEVSTSDVILPEKHQVNDKKELVTERRDSEQETKLLKSDVTETQVEDAESAGDMSKIKKVEEEESIPGRSEKTLDSKEEINKVNEQEVKNEITDVEEQRSSPEKESHKVENKPSDVQLRETENPTVEDLNTENVPSERDQKTDKEDFNTSEIVADEDKIERVKEVEEPAKSSEKNTETIEDTTCKPENEIVEASLSESVSKEVERKHTQSVKVEKLTTVETKTSSKLIVQVDKTVSETSKKRPLALDASPEKPVKKIRLIRDREPPVVTPPSVNTDATAEKIVKDQSNVVDSTTEKEKIIPEEVKTASPKRQKLKLIRSYNKPEELKTPPTIIRVEEQTKPTVEKINDAILQAAETKIETVTTVGKNLDVPVEIKTQESKVKETEEVTEKDVGVLPNDQQSPSIKEQVDEPVTLEDGAAKTEEKSETLSINVVESVKNNTSDTTIEHCVPQDDEKSENVIEIEKPVVLVDNNETVSEKPQQDRAKIPDEVTDIKITEVKSQQVNLEIISNEGCTIDSEIDENTLSENVGSIGTPQNVLSEEEVGFNFESEPLIVPLENELKISNVRSLLDDSPKSVEFSKEISTLTMNEDLTIEPIHTAEATKPQKRKHEQDPSEEPSTKTLIITKPLSVEIDDFEAGSSKEQENYPKIIIKPIPKPEERCSPKITIKPIKPPESPETSKMHKSLKNFQDEGSTPKITIKPIVKPPDPLKITITKQRSDDTHSILKIYKPDEDSEGLETIPKLTIKPITKTDDMQHSPRLTIKPVKPPTSTSPKVIVKPIISPNEQQIEITQIPKIITKPTMPPEETYPKVTIKPILRPEDQKHQQLSPRQVKLKSMTFESTSGVTVEPISMTSPPPTIHRGEAETVLSPLKISVKPFAKLDDSLSPKLTIKPITKTCEIVQTEDGSANPLKLTIKPLLKPEESYQSPKITIKPIIKPDDNDMDDIDKPERIILKINKNSLSSPKERTAMQKKEPEIRIEPITQDFDKNQKLDKIKLKLTKEGNHAQIIPSTSTFNMDQSFHLKRALTMPESTGMEKRTRTDISGTEIIHTSDISINLVEPNAKPNPKIISEEVTIMKIEKPQSASTGRQVNSEPISQSKFKEMLLKIQQKPDITCTHIRAHEDSSSSDDVKIIGVIANEPLKDPLSLNEESNSQDVVIVNEVINSNPFHDVQIIDTPTTPATVPPTPTPKKRGRPRKNPLEVKPEIKGEDNIEQPRPKRTCRAPPGRPAYIIKERKPRGAGRGRGRGRGAAKALQKLPKEPKSLRGKALREAKALAKLEAAKLQKEIVIDQITIEDSTNDTPVATPAATPVPPPDESSMKQPEIKVPTAQMSEPVLVKPAPTAVEPVLKQPQPPVALYEEETRMSADNSRSQTPARQVLIPPTPEGAEESQSSVQSTATTESNKNKKGRLEVCDPDSAVTLVEHIAEYSWGGGGPYMLQEQIAQYLGVKSFKRKYPGLTRRPVDMQERDYIREKGLVSESMCDMGLTAVPSSEILDIMYTDFQDKYEEYRKFMRDKQSKEISNKQKAISLATSQEKNKIDFKERAVRSAANWNLNFNIARKESRRCCMDLQTFTINYPIGRTKDKLPAKNPVGHYPLALVPGQYTDYYKAYTSSELHYLPINTVRYGPVPPRPQWDDGGQSDASQSDSDSSSGSDSDSSDDSSMSTTEDVPTPAAVTSAA